MILVAGIVNVETSVVVETFPINYAKSRFVFNGVGDRLGGVGYNVAAATANLGVPLRFATFLGLDLLGPFVETQLCAIPNIDLSSVVRDGATLRSVIAVDADGRGAMFTDLKDAQERVYPASLLNDALSQVGHVHASNINWALDIAHAARARSIPVSTDVQAISDLRNDVYNNRFLDVADIVFLSGENLQIPPEEAVSILLQRPNIKLVVCTIGARGVVARQRGDELIRQPIRCIDKVTNATGAGDAFAAGFLAARYRGMPLGECLRIGQETAIRRITTHVSRWPVWGDVCQ